MCVCEREREREREREEWRMRKWLWREKKVLEVCYDFIDWWNRELQSIYIHDLESKLSSNYLTNLLKVKLIIKTNSTNDYGLIISNRPWVVFWCIDSPPAILPL